MSGPLILRRVENGIFWITFNNAKRKNCITFDMYNDLLAYVKEADAHPDTILTVFSGEGGIYSSGNSFSVDDLIKVEEANQGYRVAYYHLINLLIDHKKPLVALVDGFAVGIACTSLALFDLVIAKEDAYFHCPFSSIGACPEGTSSLTFAQIMGHTKAAQMLLFDEKLSARDAFTAGLVARVIPKELDFQAEAKRLLEGYTKNLLKSSMLLGKKMIREKQRDELKQVNEYEAKHVYEQLRSDESMERIMSKFSSKSKI